MTNQQYTEALDYLLSELRNQNAADAINDINARIRRGKTVNVNDSADLKAAKISQKEVGSTQTLPLTPKEAFETCIDYLQSLVLELPLYQQQIRKVFSDNVIWASDGDAEVEAVLLQNKFSLSDITFDSQELEQARTEFNVIKKIINS